MIRVRSAPAALLAVLLTALAVFGMARPADAYMKLDAWHGHVAFGYAKLSSDSLAPAGSISVAAGIDYPLTAQWRLGPPEFRILRQHVRQAGSMRKQIADQNFVALIAFELRQIKFDRIME